MVTKQMNSKCSSDATPKSEMSVIERIRERNRVTAMSQNVEKKEVEPEINTEPTVMDKIRERNRVAALSTGAPKIQREKIVSPTEPTKSAIFNGFSPEISEIKKKVREGRVSERGNPPDDTA